MFAVTLDRLAQGVLFFIYFLHAVKYNANTDNGYNQKLFAKEFSVKLLARKIIHLS